MNNLDNLDNEQLMTVEAQYWVDMCNSLEKLKENKDFQRLILNGYFKDKAINAVSLLANEAIVRDGKRSAIMEDLIAISSLEDFFITIENLGSVSADEEFDA